MSFRSLWKYFGTHMAHTLVVLAKYMVQLGCQNYGKVLSLKKHWQSHEVMNQLVQACLLLKEGEGLGAAPGLDRSRGAS